MEDKATILAMLLPVLRKTNKLWDLRELKYCVSSGTEKEWVIATFENGFTKSINVKGDSGVQMILDVTHSLL